MVETSVTNLHGIGAPSALLHQQIIVMASQITGQSNLVFVQKFDQTEKQRNIKCSRCGGEPLVTGCSPHKATVTRKIVSFDDVIINAMHISVPDVAGT